MALFPKTDVPANQRRNDLAREMFVRGRKWLAQREDGASVLDWLDEYETAARYALSALPFQLIHRDCHVGNFLNVGTAVVGVIDWEQLSLGPRLLDVAYFAIQLVEHPPANAKEEAQWQNNVAQLWAGYEGETAVSPQEKPAFPYLLLSIPFLFANWFIETGQLPT